MVTSAVSSQDNALPGWCGCLVPVGFFLGLSCPDGFFDAARKGLP